MEEFKTPDNKLPTTTYYLIHVMEYKDDNEDRIDLGKEGEWMYDVQAAKCPSCGEENTDIQPEAVNTCLWCKKEYKVRGLNESNNITR